MRDAIAPTMLACPGCGRLVHGDQLTKLAQSAREATEQGDISAALARWRCARSVACGIEAISGHFGKDHRVGAKHSQQHCSNCTCGRIAVIRLAPLSGIGAIGVAFWKLKAILLGLTKGTTLLSMLLSLGVYWTAWGWKFALGIVLSIYVHEMGHVIALRRYGFNATAPMFIPGLGAIIRLQQKVVNGREDAAIGLAGPIYGFGAAVCSLALWFATDSPIFAAIAGVGGWINLFNLLPISSLDGGRGFHAMSRMQKAFAAATVACAWYYSRWAVGADRARLCWSRRWEISRTRKEVGRSPLRTAYWSWR